MAGGREFKNREMLYLENPLADFVTFSMMMHIDAPTLIGYGY